MTGLTAAVIGDLAGINGIYLHELSPQEVSLEEVYMELTHDHVEYRSGERAPTIEPEKVASA